MQRAFGRLESPDSRDALFPVSAILAGVPPELTEKYWWADGWWGDQGATTQCTCYSWMHLIEDGPVVQDVISGRIKPMIDPARLYKEAQIRDPWAGENYPGTSVRSVAKILKDLNIIKEYRWATNTQDVINTVLTIGPMVVGTKWYAAMGAPDARGIMSVSGHDMGGHAYIINGVNLKKNMFRVKNSWGKKWGKDGYAFIDIDAFGKLLNDGGDACIPFENKVNFNLDWTKLRTPGIYRD